MQCPLCKITCLCLVSKIIFLVICVLGLGLGILSAFSPRRSMGLYQWIMERFNWKVVPIDDAREVKSTAQAGVALLLLSFVLLALAFFRF